MYIPTTLRIIILKGNPNKMGQVPLALRFIQNRHTHRISLRKFIHPDDWMDDGNIYIREKGKSAPANARDLNLFLKIQLPRAEKILLESERNNQPLTFRHFKEKFINIEL